MTVQFQASDRNLEKKNRILSLIDERKATYSDVSVRTVLAKEGDDWRNSLTVLKALHRKEAPVESETLRYPNCILLKTSIAVEELAEVIENLSGAGKLTIKGVPEVNAQGSFSQGPWDDFAASRDERFGLEWPVNAFSFEPKTKAGPPAGPFVALESPVFPTYWEVLRVWTGLDAARHSQYAGTIVFILPNYGARIDELRLGAGDLTVKIQAGEITSDGVVGKLYCEKFGSQILQQNIDFEKDTAKIQIGFIPDMWQVYLLSKESGETLDFRSVHASWGSLPPGVVVEIGTADIEEILRRGENDQVEFKREVSKKTELIESVVAFANTAGGSIFLGVDDNGNVTGVFEQSLEERIQSMVRDNCEPMPKLTVDSKQVDDKVVYVIRVSEGTVKPYNLKNRGFFVRAGSTDRLMSRIEMDNIYSKRQSPLLGTRLW